MEYPPLKFLLAASLTAFCSVSVFGYYGGTINIPQQVFLKIINETNIRRYGIPMPDSTLNVLWGWIVGIQSVGCFVGSLATPYFAEKFGRKFTLLILNNSISLISCVLMSLFQFAHSYEMLAVGRFLCGFAGGISLSLLPVYLSECSPTRWRGLMGNLENIFFNSIYILAFVIGMPSALGTEEKLPLMLAVGFIPAVIQLISAFFLHESPKYLYIKRKDITAAEKSLRFWWNAQALDMKSILHEFDQEAKALGQELGFIQAMKIPCYRKIMLTSVIVFGCVQTCGIATIFSYSNDMFLKLGLKPDAAAICTDMVAVANTLGAPVIIPFMDRYPRRPCYFISYAMLIGTLLFYVAFAVVHEHTLWMWPSYIAVASVYAFAILFNLGPGAISFILPSEISPQSIRSTVMSVSNGIAWLLTLLWQFLYPPLEHVMGPWNFFAFIIPLIAGLVYLYRVLPETGKRTITEILREYSTDSISPVISEEGNEVDGRDFDNGYGAAKGSHIENGILRF